MKRQRPANTVAEELIRTTMKAFYPDEMIIVVDFLIRAKFCKREEISPILQMSKKTFQNSIAELEKEMIVQFELIDGTSKKPIEYCFINYRHVVNLIRYRFHLLTRNLQIVQEIQTSLSYLCPKCNKSYPELEALRARDKKGKPYCPDCCPFLSGFTIVHMKKIEVDSQYYLIPVEPSETSGQQMSRKIRNQLFSSTNTRKISSLIEEVTLLTEAPSMNIPSMNMKLGVKGITKLSQEVQAEIQRNKEREAVRAERASKEEEELSRKKCGTIFSGSNITNIQREKILADEKEREEEELRGEQAVLTAEAEALRLQQEEISRALALERRNRATVTPSHLIGSGVKGQIYSLSPSLPPPPPPPTFLPPPSLHTTVLIMNENQQKQEKSIGFPETSTLLLEEQITEEGLSAAPPPPPVPPPVPVPSSILPPGSSLMTKTEEEEDCEWVDE